MPPRPIIFTDLDGTLLDRQTYSAEACLDTIRKAQAANIPIIFCSSKTPQEQIHIRRQLGINDPFIVENGSALYLPEGFFARPIPSAKRKDGHTVLDLGLPGAIIRMHLAGLQRRLGFPLKGMSRLELDEVMALTGLDAEAAKRCKARAYSETITAPLNDRQKDLLNKELDKLGLHMACGGKFHTVTSSSADKGMAVWLLSEIFRSEWGPITSIGFGDSANDFPLLGRVDCPVLVRKPDGGREDMPIPHLRTTEGIGPAGWAEAMETIFAELKEVQSDSPQ